MVERALVIVTTSASAAPAYTAGENGVGQLRVGKVKGNAAVQGDVVEAPVPDSSISHAVRAEGHGCSDESTSHHIVPVVKFVNGQSTTNEDST